MTFSNPGGKAHRDALWRHLVAEQPTPCRTVSGAEYDFWDLAPGISHRENHWFDCAVGIRSMLVLAGAIEVVSLPNPQAEQKSSTTDRTERAKTPRKKLTKLFADDIDLDDFYRRI